MLETNKENCAPYSLGPSSAKETEEANNVVPNLSFTAPFSGDLTQPSTSFTNAASHQSFRHIMHHSHGHVGLQSSTDIVSLLQQQQAMLQKLIKQQEEFQEKQDQFNAKLKKDGEQASGC